jgi:glutathione synthase/RimK-type ligase-like ATP-grasp enzyme
LNGGLLSLEPRLWINHPHANDRARSKLLQLRIAAGLGFAIPDTRVTADAEEIRRIYQDWGGRMVAKLAGGQIVADSIEQQYVVYTTPISAEDLADTASLTTCPAIYQRRIDRKYDLRVTIVGEDIFACRIDTQALEMPDWRAVERSTLRHEAHDLDAPLRDRCRALMRAFALDVAGIDFIVTPNGETVFLEINAAGQWAWIEDAIGCPIASTLARRLATAASKLD